MGDLAAIIGDVSLFHYQLLKLVTRLVPRCNTKSAMFTINKCIYNHHPEDFARKDLEVIAFLMCAWGTKHAWLYSSIEWAWFLWYFETEVPMLMCGIILFGLQSRHLILHGLLVLHLKRCILERSSLRTTYSRPEEGGPNSIEDNDDRSSSQKVKGIFQVALFRRFCNFQENRLGWYERRCMHHLLERVLLGKQLCQRIF